MLNETEFKKLCRKNYGQLFEQIGYKPLGVKFVEQPTTEWATVIRVDVPMRFHTMWKTYEVDGHKIPIQIFNCFGDDFTRVDADTKLSYAELDSWLGENPDFAIKAVQEMGYPELRRLSFVEAAHDDWVPELWVTDPKLSNSAVMVEFEQQDGERRIIRTRIRHERPEERFRAF